MSYVTGAMLICRAHEDKQIAAIKQWLAEKTGFDDEQLAEVSDHAGGGKHPQFHAYCGGFNYFDEDEFAMFAMSREWEFPENVVLILQPEDGPTRTFTPMLDLTKFGPRRAEVSLG